MTPGDLSILDQRLKLLEGRLVESIRPSKTESETVTSHHLSRKAKPQHIAMRLIRPGILTYEENGKVVSELIPVDDRKAMQLDAATRFNLIRHA